MGKAHGHKNVDRGYVPGLCAGRRRPLYLGVCDPEGTFSRPHDIGGIRFRTMPFYHRVYSPGKLQFITTSTYRRTPLFLSDRFRRGFVQKSRGPWEAGPRYELMEVRQELHFLLVGWAGWRRPWFGVCALPKDLWELGKAVAIRAVASG